ncbi:MAG: hypothetical protein KR126chlam6_00770 [Candidatus Anoxychlamydiales bacterium]|nr:hypothetical protein [Candidatus Anoxychlamydiales bacterium]
MDNKGLLKKVAKLESQLDIFETEFETLNKILIKCGFPNGIVTLKETANQLLKENQITFDI